MDTDKVLREPILPVFSHISDQPINKHKEQEMTEMTEKKTWLDSCCETFCDCFGKSMECCLPCALCCFLLER
jgi:hypothetical protein